MTRTSTGMVFKTSEIELHFLLPILGFDDPDVPRYSFRTNSSSDSKLSLHTDLAHQLMLHSAKMLEFTIVLPQQHRLVIV